MSSWSPPRTRTRTGASHTRRGAVCQDASSGLSLKDKGGRPVQLMAVADGHGGQRYTRSEVGSRLACELALKRLAEQLEQWSTTGPEAAQRWLAWLRDSFPREVHQRWLQAVEQHWRQAGPAGEADFSPLPYGTTLALVVMTPGWWGHTGLGDWDLVLLGADGEAELLSEEGEQEQGGGEATYSLCLSNAPRHFAPRTAVYPLASRDRGFSLLLSTDGVRKSCSTDADFFTIAHYLCGTTDLDADLDRISSQGSGDDVSVAIGRWKGGSTAPAPAPGRATPALIPPPTQVPFSVTPAPARGRAPRLPWIAAVVLLAALSGGVLAAARFGLGWRPPALPWSLGPWSLGRSRPAGPPPAQPARPELPPPPADLTALAERLCQQPERIDDLLNNYGKAAHAAISADPSRRADMLQLAAGASEPEQIAALVAWVMTPAGAPLPSQAPSLAEAQRQRQQQLQRLQACEALNRQTEDALARWSTPPTAAPVARPAKPVQAPSNR